MLRYMYNQCTCTLQDSFQQVSLLVLVKSVCRIWIVIELLMEAWYLQLVVTIYSVLPALLFKFTSLKLNALAVSGL